LVANVDDFDADKLVENMEDAFEITSYQFDNDKEKIIMREQMFSQLRLEFEDLKNAFGIYAGGKAFYIAVLKDSVLMDRFGEMSAAAKGLDVNVLHKLILEDVLGIGDEQLASQSNVKYIKDIGDAIKQSIAKVDSNESQIVFFMNPTRVEQVRDIAAAGEKMPQKSTFFYPKIFTGLVINKL
ncbi:MAG: DUF1015 domain-containing protein, partial [Planctomycetes bacterium]|nr:DUF1015 domain-containing protein [Planctomycetota bacterium]